MMLMFSELWENHGERLVFMFLALCFSAGMYLLGWVEEAKVIIIGLAMLCYNKARGGLNITADDRRKKNEIKNL